MPEPDIVSTRKRVRKAQDALRAVGAALAAVERNQAGDFVGSVEVARGEEGDALALVGLALNDYPEVRVVVYGGQNGSRDPEPQGGRGEEEHVGQQGD